MWLKCVEMKDVPFFMVRNDSDTTLSGNERFHGFNVDVIRALSAMLNFRYELYVVGDQLESGGKAASVSDNVVQQLTEGVSTSINSIPAVHFFLVY